ncbi:MAG TPA: hypothetical protein VFB45_27015 [Pseudolabrys sp.]|nr:hypothetical protein [Pseudolabrys sp.]
MRLPAPPLALAGLALLVGLNGWLLLEAIGQFAADDAAPAPTAAWTPHLSDFGADEKVPKAAPSPNEILVRPIFSKSRAPFVAPPPPPPKVVAAPAVAFVDPGFVLGGVMINGQIKRAYLQRKVDLSGAWVGEGEDFVGWKVQTINEGTAILRKESRTINVELYATR